MYKTTLISKKASRFGKEYIQQKDVIILPESKSVNLIHKTLHRKNKSPVFFIIRKGNHAATSEKYAGKQICCRIADFSCSDSSAVILPDWMFDSLEISENDKVTLAEILIENGREVILRPHDGEMLKNINDLGLDVSNVLSMVISNYGCLTKDSTIEVSILGRSWKIDVVDIKDINGKSKTAISVLDIDLELELLPAKNYIPGEIGTTEIIEQPGQRIGELFAQTTNNADGNASANADTNVVTKVDDNLAKNLDRPPNLETLPLEEMRRRRLQALGM